MLRTTRTTRVDKNESVCDIYTDLVASGECYLYHRSVVDNITAVIPILLLVENVICIIDQW